jgi:predicted TIM-barrel fold metal-dependent hydrolase
LTAVPDTSPADIPVISTPRKSPSLDVVDAQIHVRGEPGLAIAAMDAVGVEAAVVDIYPPDTQVDDDGITRYDLRLARTAIERFPGRFAYMGRVDPADPDLDDIMTRFAETPDVVCVRTSERADLEAGRDAPMLAAAGRFGIPVMIVVAARHEAMMRYLAEFDGVQFILDHVAMDALAPRSARPSISASVDALLAYAPYPNVAVKWTQAPRLSQERYPFPDVLEQLARTVEAFGADRIMWGSDYTVTRHHHTYAEALFYVRDTDLLSDRDKGQVLGATLRRILQWPRKSGAAA